MKQYITTEQANSIPDYKFERLYKKLYGDKDKIYSADDITIGKMIEILGDDFGYICYQQNQGGDNYYEVSLIDPAGSEIYYKNKELCDALWEAVEQRL